MKPLDVEKFYRVQAPIYDVTRKTFLFHRKRAIELLDIQSGQEVADFGCGTGLNLPLLAKTKARRIYGIDLSDAMLERAHEKAPSALLFEEDLEQFRMKPRVDRIISSYALSMVENWETALENMISSLKPEGVLVVLDFSPFRSVLKPLDPALNWWLGKFGVHHRQNVRKVFQKRFFEVYEEVPRVGYSSICVGRRPRNMK